MMMAGDGVLVKSILMFSCLSRSALRVPSPRRQQVPRNYSCARYHMAAARKCICLPVSMLMDDAYTMSRWKILYTTLSCALQPLLLQRLL